MFQTQNPADFLKQTTEGLLGQFLQNAFASISKLDPHALTQSTPEINRMQKAWMDQHLQLWHAVLGHSEQVESSVEKPLPPVKDRRFSSPAWETSPIHDYSRRAYLLNAQFLRELAELIPLTDELGRQKLNFAVSQYVEALAPSNFAATNPEVIKAAVESGGESIRRGIENLLSDLDKGRISMTDDTAFAVGRNLAVTSGAVIYENEVFQLIQYSPLTDKVAQRPLLIVPPCINKYYILDLQAQNSFVRYAVEQGNTVFLVSWRNVSGQQAHLGWDDYVELGVLRALAIVREIGRVKQINVLGFCVGGTLLTSALAVAKGRGEDPVKSLTLLTTFLDFSDPGEIGMFIDEASVAAREQSLGQGGILPGRELAAVFSALRPNDLIWQYVVGNYLKGATPPAFDLLYWNCDPTNLPGPFFAWYLRHMYLENALKVPGKLAMCGVPVDLGKVNMPAFVFAAKEDHIVPWRSAFDSHKLLTGETTFVLGASGHIAGVINPAASGKRSYWTSASSAQRLGADEWLAETEEHKGSWWPFWSAWLQKQGGRKIAARVELGNEKYSPIESAPGRYVTEKA